MTTVIPALVILVVGVVIALVLNHRDKNVDLFDAELGVKPFTPPAEMRYGVTPDTTEKQA